MAVSYAYHPITFLPPRSPGQPVDVNVFDNACRRIAGMGWKGIEFSADLAMETWNDPSDYSRILSRNDLVPVTLYTPYGVTERELLESMRERARAAFDYLAAAGCEFALLDGSKQAEDGDLNEKTALLAESANIMALLAVKAGIRAVWHQHYGSVIEHEEQFLSFLGLIDEEHVGLCLDTAQLTLGGIPLRETFERCCRSIRYVHFKDLDDQRRMRELGGGRIQFGPLRDILVRTGFNGWICTDLDYVTGMPAAKAAQRSLERLRELFQV